MDFTGRHVVVTGGSAGIGRATAERIATVAMEVAPSGVRCNCLHPGFIDTP